MFLYTTINTKNLNLDDKKTVKDKLKETNQEEVSLAGIVLSLSLFASKLDKDKKSFKIFFKLLLLSFLILLPSLILGRDEHELEQINTVERIKFGAVLNSISMVTVAILVIYKSII